MIKTNRVEMFEKLLDVCEGGGGSIRELTSGYKCFLGEKTI